MRSFGLFVVAGLVLTGWGQDVSVGDDPRYDLLPGMSFSLRVRFDRLNHAAGNVIVVQRGARLDEVGGYNLSVENPMSGGRFAFQINLEGNPEPLVRLALPAVRSPRAVETNVWYDITAGWDGEKTYLVVNGERSELERSGPTTRLCGPFFVGPVDGSIEDFSFASPVRGEADRGEPFLAPGFAVGCTVALDALPHEDGTILEVPGQYRLGWLARERGEGCKNRGFTFALCLDGKWGEPCEYLMDFRENPMEAGRRYDVVATWDGRSARLLVDGWAGERAKLRTGCVSAATGSLKVHSFRGQVEDIRFRAEKEAVPYLGGLHTPGPLPRSGRPLVLQGLLENRGGSPLEGAELVISESSGAQVSPARLPLEALAPHAERTVSWKIDRAPAECAEFTIDVMKDGRSLCRRIRRVMVLPEKDPDYSAAAFNPPVSGRTAYYVDAIGGDDASAGTSEAKPWRTFANLKGRILGPGCRLLLKRDSVFNEELVVTVRASAEDWAEVGAYGKGARPQIRRNRYILDRCAFVLNPQFLIVRDLVVADAALGFVCRMTDPQAGNVLFERCLAHHIEGLYRFNSHGIPEWRDVYNPEADESGGIVAYGPENKNVVVRDCETYQCSAGLFLTRGRNVTVQRVYCHDAAIPNTSPHPFFAGNSKSRILDSVFDASGYQASCGTMGIMVSEQQCVSLRNVFFQNMPDTDSWDEGAIDFEALGENTEIDRCTFRNNAGAAIEVLSPGLAQTKNLRITGCRFFKDNFAGKLGPAEVTVSGGSANRGLDCSTGEVSGNGAVLNPGIAFYTNHAVVTHSDWVVKENRVFDAPEALDRAFPYNEPPVVTAGAEIWTTGRSAVLSACVQDDGRSGRNVAIRWEPLEGPAGASVASAGEAAATASLPSEGDYRFLFAGDDGQFWRTARTAVHVLPKGLETVRAWTFAKDHDKEGWTYSGLGTGFEKFERRIRPTVSYPVHDVGGDYFIVAIRDSQAASLVSPPGIGLVSGSGKPVVRFRLQNRTNARRMSVAWTEPGPSTGTGENSVSVDLEPQDLQDRVYEAVLPTGAKVDRLRLMPVAGGPVTGTLRIDYVWCGLKR